MKELTILKIFPNRGFRNYDKKSTNFAKVVEGHTAFSSRMKAQRSISNKQKLKVSANFKDDGVR